MVHLYWYVFFSAREQYEILSIAVDGLGSNRKMILPYSTSMFSPKSWNVHNCLFQAETRPF